MTRRRLISFGGLVLLTFLLAVGCTLLGREDSAAGAEWYIKLRIQAPGSSKGITVGELDVTGMTIDVLTSGEEVLQSIDWKASDGPQEYLVAVPQPGEYRLEVTHFGEREGEQVQAQESAAFNIQAMKITVIDIVPGCMGLIRVEGEQPPIDLTGYWDIHMTADSQYLGFDVFYIQQQGTDLDCSHGFAGSIDGASVYLEAGVEPSKAVGTGTVSGDVIDGTITGLPFGSGTVTFHMVRSTLTYGRLDLDGMCQGGPISIHKDGALGALGAPDVGGTGFDLFYDDNVVRIWLHCGFPGVTPPSGPYDWLIGLDWEADAGPGRVIIAAESVTMTITRFNETGIAGEFFASFADGDTVSGTFDVSFNEWGWL